MKSVKIGLSAAVGLGALLWLSLHPRLGTEIAASSASVSADAAAGPTAPSALAAPSSSSVPVASSVQKIPEVKTVVVSTSAKLAPEVHDRLATLSKVERKVFTSDSEKAARAASLHDETFLRQVAGVLTSRALDATTVSEQNQAIDALLSAQAAGSTVATELLKSVVTDAAVEDAQLPSAVRENLAGLKAEVMFKWTAADPSSHVGDLAMGPVSQRIWANVQDQQSRNVAESTSIGAHK